ncbi:FGGY family carbohydrate kinase [Variovorax sp. AFSI2.2]|uniref:FGGY family carbohydrate kinase n=1 Tax=Variovorax sp. AFSI2.2 TaxID=3384160 RepID=UPI003EB8A3BB
MAAIAVLDIGKTTLKLGIYASTGAKLASFEAPNRPIPGVFYLEPDHRETWEFFLASLARSQASQPISDIIVSTHGSSGYLVNEDGTWTPLPDYESAMPHAVQEAYIAESDGLEERGSGISPGSGHLARQLFWVERITPNALLKAIAILPAAQFWAWRLSGVMATELTALSAQTHLWNAHEDRFTSLVYRRGWQRLMPAVRHAGDVLGKIEARLATLIGVGLDTRVHCGVHDSTANFFRYQSSGYEDFTLLSSGTWLVSMSDMVPVLAQVRRDYTVHVSASRTPFWSVRIMAGRDFDTLSHHARDCIDLDRVNGVLNSGVFALPSFGPVEGFLKGSGGRGEMVGAPREGAIDRAALALVYYALLADLSLDTYPDRGDIVVDGNITAQESLGSLIAAMREGRRVLFSSAKDGTLIGAAYLAGARPSSPPLMHEHRHDGIDLRALQSYRTAWRAQVLERYPDATPFVTAKRLDGGDQCDEWLRLTSRQHEI